MQFDGDGQHLAREISSLIAPLEAGDADVVVGSRFAIKGHGYVHTTMQGRIGGTSFINLWRSTYYMIKVTLALCIERLRASLRGV